MGIKNNRSFCLQKECRFISLVQTESEIRLIRATEIRPELQETRREHEKVLFFETESMRSTHSPYVPFSVSRIHSISLSYILSFCISLSPTYSLSLCSRAGSRPPCGRPGWAAGCRVRATPRCAGRPSAGMCSRCRRSTCPRAGACASSSAPTLTVRDETLRGRRSVSGTVCICVVEEQMCVCTLARVATCARVCVCVCV